jgi:hypothetical protein
MKVGPAALDEPLHFGEERRRTKVIPHAFGERAVFKGHAPNPGPTRNRPVMPT